MYKVHMKALERILQDKPSFCQKYCYLTFSLNIRFYYNNSEYINLILFEIVDQNMFKCFMAAYLAM